MGNEKSPVSYANPLKAMMFQLMCFKGWLKLSFKLQSEIQKLRPVVEGKTMKKSEAIMQLQRKAMEWEEIEEESEEDEESEKPENELENKLDENEKEKDEKYLEEDEDIEDKNEDNREKNEEAEKNTIEDMDKIPEEKVDYEDKLSPNIFGTIEKHKKPSGLFSPSDMGENPPILNFQIKGSEDNIEMDKLQIPNFDKIVQGSSEDIRLGHRKGSSKFSNKSGDKSNEKSDKSSQEKIPSHPILQANKSMRHLFKPASKPSVSPLHSEERKNVLAPPLEKMNSLYQIGLCKSDMVIELPEKMSQFSSAVISKDGKVPPQSPSIVISPSQEDKGIKKPDPSKAKLEKRFTMAEIQGFKPFKKN